MGLSLTLQCKALNGTSFFQVSGGLQRIMKLPKHLVLFKIPQDTPQIFVEGHQTLRTPISCCCGSWRLMFQTSSGLKNLCQDTKLHPQHKVKHMQTIPQPILEYPELEETHNDPRVQLLSFTGQAQQSHHESPVKPSSALCTPGHPTLCWTWSGPWEGAELFWWDQ